jgi:hypothetical protein
MAGTNYKVGIEIDAKGAKGAVAELSAVDKVLNQVGVNAKSSLDGLAGSSSALSAAGVAGTAAAIGITAVATAAVSAGRAIFDLTVASSDLGSVIFDASQKTGLGAETLSSLKFAADQSGSSFEQVSGSITKFTKLIGEAAQGSKEATAKLRALGVDPKAAISDLDGALAGVFKRINDLPPGVQQTKAAIDAFGKSGAELIPVITGMDGDLEGLIKRAKHLGITMTDEDVAAADRFGDALVDLKAQAAGLGFQFSKNLMPILSDFAVSSSEWFAANKTDIQDWGRATGDALSGVVSVLKVLKDNFTAVRIAAAAMSFGLTEAIGQGLAQLGRGLAQVGADARLSAPPSEIISTSSGSYSSTNRGSSYFSPGGGSGRIGGSRNLAGGGRLNGAVDPFVANRTEALFNQSVSSLAPWLKAMIEKEAKAAGVPVKLALAQLFSESSFNPKAVSPFNKNVGSSAYGLTQQLPATASRMLGKKVTGADLTSNPELALSAWGKYMSFLFNRYGDWELATLAYHQGEGTVDKLVKILDKGGSTAGFFAARPKGKAYVSKIAKLSGIRGDSQFSQDFGDVGGDKSKRSERVIGEAEAAAYAKSVEEVAAAFRQFGLIPDLTEVEKLNAILTDPKNQEAISANASAAGMLIDDYKKALLGMVEANQAAISANRERVIGEKEAAESAAKYGQSVRDLQEALRGFGLLPELTEIDRLNEVLNNPENAKAIEDEAKKVGLLVEEYKNLLRVRKQMEAAMQGAGRGRYASGPKSRSGSFMDGIIGKEGVKQIQTEADAVASIYEFLGSTTIGVMNSMIQAGGQLLEQYILTGEGASAAFAQMAAGVISGIAVQAGIKALFEVAEGVAAAANPATAWQAPGHFAAAKMYGVVSGVAAGIGIGIGAAGGLQGGSNKDQSGSPDYQTASTNTPPRRNQAAQNVRAVNPEMSGFQKTIEDLRTTVSRLSSATPGSVLIAGTKEKPGHITQTNIREMKGNASFVRDTARVMKVG